MKLKDVLLIISSSVILTSCNYLDVVPSEIPQLSDAFKNEATAQNYIMGNVYGYIPTESSIAENPALLSTDELDIPWRNDKTNFKAYHINLGTLDTSSPYFNLWEGANGSKALYKGIREAYVFLENIDQVPDLDVAKKARWIAEAHFLIGYYHFCLLRQYGPIIVARNSVDMNAPEEQRYPRREPVDNCFNFILENIDYAINNGLPQSVTSNEWGRITTLIAKSLKSRILLYRASPIFNGNEDYSNFKDSDGTILVNTVYDAEKWKAAADISFEAIQMAETKGVKLYKCSTNSSLTFADSLLKAKDLTGIIPGQRPKISYNSLSEEKRKEYDYRYTMVDPWNCELIWGFTNIENNQTWQRHSMLRPYTFNGISPTLKMVEAYYTRNGLPIEQDPEFDYEKRYQLVAADNVHCYDRTLRLHYNREPRFYASIAFDNSIYELRGANILCEMRFNKPYGKQSQDASSTGYLVKKGVHPSSDCQQSGQTGLLVKYPFPLIRLAELYLNYAEALNEYEGEASHSKIIPYLDKIRERAGIPALLKSWSKARYPKTSFTKDEMREIIHRERMIELSFEGHRMWDIRRWKIARQEFDQDVKGWDVSGQSVEEFYNVSGDMAQPQIVADRNFPNEKYALWPISITEIQKNRNLVQTDGW